MTRITIALCTYNGAKHLTQQLESFRAQDHQDWDLWVADDGSDDGTWEILQRFARQEQGQRHVRLLHGPGQGGTTNYLSLLCHPDFPTGPVALSDQDDVWLPRKLSLALAGLKRGGDVTLYGAQYHYVDAGLQVFGSSHPPRRPISFANALTQNMVSGHTAMLSAAALALVRQAGVQDVPYHDWWLYQLITGAGGDVVIDPARVLHYRQHGTNVLGAHHGLRASLQRASMVLGHTYGGWVQANLTALRGTSALLTPQNQALLRGLLATPAKVGLRRPYALWRAGLYRQTWLTTSGVYLAAALGRL